MAMYMGGPTNPTNNVVNGSDSVSNPPAMPKPDKRFDVGAFMNVLLALSPLLELKNPGAGMGTAVAVLQTRAHQERQQREDGLALTDYLTRVDEKDLDINAAALISMGWDPKVVQSSVKMARTLKPKKSALELETERLMEALAPEVAQSRTTGVPLQQVLTPERVRELQTRGVQIPFDVQSQDVVTGTRPVTEEQRFPITRPPLVTRTSDVGVQPTRATALVTRHEPIVERRENVVVRGAKAAAVPTFGELFPAANDTPFGRAKIPVDKNGNPDLNEASQIAARLGWVRTEADIQAQRERHQQFLRDKLAAHFAGTQRVDLGTLRAQMDDLGMVFGAEVVDARKRAKEDPETSMVTVKDPVTGQMVTIPATSLPSFYPRRAPGERDGDDGDRVRNRQMEAKRIEAQADFEAATEEKRFLLGNSPARTIADPADPSVTKPNPEFTEWRKRLADADNTIRRSRATIRGLDQVQNRPQPQPQHQEFDSLPNPAKYAGRTIRDTKTGKRYKSDGRQWVEVKQ